MFWKRIGQTIEPSNLQRHGNKFLGRGDLICHHPEKMRHIEKYVERLRQEYITASKIESAMKLRIYHFLSHHWRSEKLSSRNRIVHFKVEM